MAKFTDEINESNRIDEKFDLLFEVMSGNDIARELGITKQAVNATLQRAMKKVFLAVKDENKDKNAFEVAAIMLQMMNIPDSEVKWFFKSFPTAIKKEIEDSVPEWGKRLIK